MTTVEAFTWLTDEAERQRKAEVARLAAEVGVTPEVWSAKCYVDVVLVPPGEWRFEARRRASSTA